MSYEEFQKLWETSNSQQQPASMDAFVKAFFGETAGKDDFEQQFRKIADNDGENWE